jgi:eukaryotic-like serine/threonine-protein kinase
MICPACGTDTPAPLDRCFRCSTPLPSRVTDDGVTVVLPAPETTGATAETAAPTNAHAPNTGSVQTTAGSVDRGSLPIAPGETSLRIGETFGRYRIIRLLGSGGMGHVYHAWDQELAEAVALKVIRPEYASNTDADARFKRELSVARQVTHKNVVRIHDLGQVGNVKFISMSFIEGVDLATMIRLEMLPRDLALSIVRQVLDGLAAAHQAGVAHRDLKPANIMIDRAGQAYLMDFGLARSVEATQYTMAGTVLGTIDYMSPEQAMGEAADFRSDIFTIGIILFELFTGERPFKGETPASRLSERLHKTAPDPRTIHADVPPYLAQIMMRCLERDPSLRYQRVEEILADFDAHQASERPRPAVWQGPGSRKAAAAALVLLALGAAALVVRRGAVSTAGPAKPVASGPTVSLAILPFRNTSGDPTLAWLGTSLAEVLRTDVGQSAYLRTVSSDRLDQTLRDLHISPDASFDADGLRRLSEFTNADTVLWGQYLKVGGQIRIDATLQDYKHQRTVPLKVEAPSEKELLKAIDELARSVQQTVVASPDLIKELQANSSKPSSTSLQALRDYNDGLQLARQGNNLEALKRFESATSADPEFALAYSRLAQTHANLGHDTGAEQASRRAVELSQKLPPRERYLIVAAHARILNDNQKAIESYENLVKVSPEDSDVNFTLGRLYEDTGALDKARAEYAKVLARDPKYVNGLFAMGRVEIRRANAQGALEYLNNALTFAIQLENEEQRADVLNAIGVAYKRLNKPDEALRYYQDSLVIKRRIGQKRGIAITLGEVAQIQNRLGQSDLALASYKEAERLQREIGDKRGLGTTLINLGTFYDDRGQYDQGLQLFKESLQIQRDTGNQSFEALCLNNIGNAYLSKGQYEDAQTYFERALQLREKLKVSGDIADVLHNLGETSSKMGEYDHALGHYLRALELRRSGGDKRGAAIESYSTGTIFEYQGRYGAAVNAKEAALKTFQALQDRSFWMAEVLSGYGNALSQIGKDDEAQKNLEQALNLARELKNQTLVAQTLDFQGNRLFYRGDFKAARVLLEQATQAAARLTDRQVVLRPRLDLAKLAVKEGRPQGAIRTLRELADESSRLGLKYLSVESSVYLGQALLDTKDYSAARRELENALATSDKLGLRALLAQSHYFLATVLRRTGHEADASRHFADARRVLEEIRKEPRSDELTKRVDLNVIVADSSR